MKPLTLNMRLELRYAFAQSKRYGVVYRFRSDSVDGNQLNALTRRGLVERSDRSTWYHQFTTKGLVALQASESTLKRDRLDAVERPPKKVGAYAYSRVPEHLSTATYPMRDHARLNAAREIKAIRKQRTIQELVRAREKDLWEKYEAAQAKAKRLAEEIAHLNRRYPVHEKLGVS